MNCRIASTLLVTGALALGATACGSDDEKSEDPGGQTAETPARVTGASGKQGDFKPDKNAPESAGDRKSNAPDKDIVKKPGGKDSPVSP